jgi:capsular polysaccharide biosynthesis protein/Mrp family chromosome partitioning ATPase
MLSMPMSGHPAMDLRKYLGVLRARRWLITGIVGAAVLFALLASLTQSDRYRASAELLFGRTAAADAIIAGGTAAGAEVPETKPATNLALASLDSVAARVKDKLGWRATVGELKSAVQIAPRGDSDLMTVTAEWSSPTLAADLANAFATEVAALRREVAQADIRRAIDALKATLAQQPTPTPAPDAPAGTPAPAESAATLALRDRISELELLESLENGGVSVVERATPPSERSAPTPLRNAVIAAFLALVLAAFAVLLLARLEDRIDDEEQLTALVGVPILARIPQLPRARPLAPTAAESQDLAFLEAFEFLRLNVELRRADKLGRPGDGGVVFAITSPRAHEGKTTVVSWLARAFGASGGNVVAVDLDVRKPELHRLVSSFAQGNGFPPLEPADADSPVVVEPSLVAARRVYTDEEIEASLTQLALCRGNARRAAQFLKSAGLDVAESTLRRWKVTHAARYRELEAANALQSAARYVTNATLLPNVRLFTAADDPAFATQPGAPERLRGLFAELRSQAGCVLVDTPPVATVAEASAIAAEADDVLLIVDLARLRRRDLLATKRQLDHARANVIGIVLNRSSVGAAHYDAPANGGGSLAGRLADSSRATLRRVTRPQRTPESGSRSWIGSLIGLRDEPPDRE